TTGIQSPTEYLSTRYSLPTQQVMAWTGVIAKLFDVAAKWAAIGILLQGFTGLPIEWSIITAGLVTLLYINLGRLWADVMNDLASFVIQFIVGIILFITVLAHLGEGIGGIFALWDRLPESHSNLFNAPYTPGFALAFMVICFFSYSGGTWNLATRFISSSSGSEAKKAATLSMVLYLLWPLILFFPMFAARVFLPDIENPEQSYPLMALKFLPPGVLGLLLASMFSNTLTMTGSDANTISAVITRDIFPVLFKKVRTFDIKRMLLIARITTFTFLLATILIAFKSSSFGGVIGLVVSWFSALLCPIAIPMILGLLPAFRKCDSRAALLSIGGGLLVFLVTKFYCTPTLSLEIAAPTATSLIIFAVFGFISRNN